MESNDGSNVEIPGYQLTRVVARSPEETWAGTSPSGKSVYVSRRPIVPGSHQDQITALTRISKLAIPTLARIVEFFYLDNEGNRSTDTDTTQLIVVTEANQADQFPVPTGRSRSEAVTLLRPASAVFDQLNHPAQGPAVLFGPISDETICLRNGFLCLISPVWATLIAEGDAVPMIVVPEDSPYVAPEMNQFRMASRWSDQYALSAIYQQLRENGEPFTPSEQALLDRAQTVSPDQRFTRSSELIGELGQLVVPAPSTGGQRAAPTPTAPPRSQIDQTMSFPGIGTGSNPPKPVPAAPVEAQTPPPGQSANDTVNEKASETVPPPREPATPSTLDPDNLVGAQIKHYQVKECLGRGNMGAVYRAYHSRLDIDVAIKVPKFDSRTEVEAINRFQLEAKAAAQIRDDNICHVYDVDKAGDLHYIVMEFIQGQTLSDLVKEGPVDPVYAAEIVAKVAHALEKVHQKNIVHRDIKSSNVMLDENGTPKITDFGLARQIKGESGLTQTGSLMGTPAYMSPEQAEGKNEAIDHRTDIYSLGVMLYELIVGQLPFRGSIAEVLGSIVYKDPAPPRSVRPEIDSELEAICLKSMAKSADERYRSGAEFAQAMYAYLTPPAPTIKAPSLAKRLIGVAAAVLAIGVTSFLGFKLMQEQDKQIKPEIVQMVNGQLEQPDNWQEAAGTLRDLRTKFPKNAWVNKSWSTAMGFAVDAGRNKLNGLESLQSPSPDQVKTELDQVFQHAELIRQYESESPGANELCQVAVTRSLKFGEEVLEASPERAKQIAAVVVETAGESPAATALSENAQTRIDMSELRGRIVGLTAGETDKLAKLRSEVEGLDESQKLVARGDVERKFGEILGQNTLDELLRSQAVPFVDVMIAWDFPDLDSKLHLKKTLWLRQAKQFPEARSSLEKAIASATDAQQRTILWEQARLAVEDPSSTQEESESVAGQLRQVLRDGVEEEKTEAMVLLAGVIPKVSEPSFRSALADLTGRRNSAPPEFDAPFATALQRRVTLDYQDISSADKINSLLADSRFIEAHGDPDALVRASYAETTLLRRGGTLNPDSSDLEKATELLQVDETVKKARSYGHFVDGLSHQGKNAHAAASSSYRTAFENILKQMPPEPWQTTLRRQFAGESLYKLAEQTAESIDAYKALRDAIRLHPNPPTSYRIRLVDVAPLDDKPSQQFVEEVSTELLDSDAPEVEERYALMVKNAQLRIKLAKNGEALDRLEQLVEMWSEKDLSITEIGATTFFKDALGPALVIGEALLREQGDASHRRLAKLYAAKGRLISRHEWADWENTEGVKEATWTAATESFANAIKLHPYEDLNKAKYYTEHGFSLVHMIPMPVDEIREDARLARRASSSYAGAEALKGYLAYDQGNKMQAAFGASERVAALAQEAIDAYTKAIALAEKEDDPQKNRAMAIYHSNRSNAYVLLGNNRTHEGPKAVREDYLFHARDDALRATELDKYFVQAYGNLGNAWEDISWSALGQQVESFPQAIAAFGKEIEQERSRAQAHTNLGRCYFKWYEDTGKNNNEFKLKSKEHLQDAIKRDPKHPEANYWLGKYWLDEENKTEATKSFTATLSNPYGQAWFDLIASHLGAASPEFAQIVNAAVPQDPSSGHVKLLIARFLLAARRNQAAALASGDAALAAQLTDNAGLRYKALSGQYKISRNLLAQNRQNNAFKILHHERALALVNASIEVQRYQISSSLSLWQALRTEVVEMEDLADQVNSKGDRIQLLKMAKEMLDVAIPVAPESEVADLPARRGRLTRKLREAQSKG